MWNQKWLWWVAFKVLQCWFLASNNSSISGRHEILLRTISNGLGFTQENEFHQTKAWISLHDCSYDKLFHKIAICCLSYGCCLTITANVYEQHFLGVAILQMRLWLLQSLRWLIDMLLSLNIKKIQSAWYIIMLHAIS